MKQHPLHSIRVADINWLDQKRFYHLLRLLKEYPCGISQVALFTSPTHIPLTLQENQRRMDIARTRMQAIRDAGLSAGINILPTIGHHCEDLDAGLGDRYTFMTNIHGEVCRGCYCMRNPEYLEQYVVPCYTQLANAKPDFIWIDDDIRYGHWPIGNGCFCDRCVGTFNEKHGTSYTRETLREALNQNDVSFRKKWLDHNSDAICGLFRVIAKTVYSIHPDIRLGFMTGERYFEGYQFAAYAEALSDGGKHEIMWRPGGGAYSDINFDSIVEKQEQTGRQNAYLPNYVTISQYELENFPYQLIKKTPKSTATEAAMSMTVGCTGAAFNMLVSETGESLDEMIPYLRTINRLVPFYETLAEQTQGLTPAGIHTGWRIDSQAAVPAGEFVNMGGNMYAGYARELFSFGLPECYHKDHANVVTLTGQAAAVMDDDEIRKLLSGGVYLDVSALNDLRQRGYADLLGFSVEKEIPVDARECYTDHPFNAGFTGGLRNCRQAFNNGDSYALKMEADGCQSLAKLVDYHDRVWSDCTIGIFENRLGGHICTAGYYPFSLISDSFKTKQLKRLFVWLSGGTLPSFVDSFHRVRNITLTGNGKVCVTLFNTSNDDIDLLRIAVRTDKTEAKLYTMYNDSQILHADKAEVISGGLYQSFTIDHILPYEGMILSL